MIHGGRDGKPGRAEISEQVQRVRVVEKDKVECVTLRERRYETRPDSAGAVKEEIDAGVDLEEFTDNILGITLALDAADAFDYRLLDRRLIGDYLVYHVGFEPRSAFAPLPSGEAWIETGDLVVLHENFWMRDVVPFPMILESVEMVSRERERIEGRWVWTRLQGRLRTRLGPLGGPEWVEICDTHGDYRFPPAGVGGSWFVGGRRGLADLEVFRQAIAESSAAVFAKEAAVADMALADSLGAELEAVGFEALRRARGAPKPESRFVPGTGPWGMNRVDGPRPGLGVSFFPSRALRVDLAGAYATATKRGQGEAAVSVRIGRRRFDGAAIRLSISDRTTPMLTNDPPGAGLLMLSGLDDPCDHYRRREVSLGIEGPVGSDERAWMRFSAGDDEARSVEYERHPFRSEDYRPNPAAWAGPRNVLLVGVERGGAARAVAFRFEWEWSDAALGGSECSYTRAEAALRWAPHARGPLAMSLLLRAGEAAGAPLQRRFSLGGTSTLRALSPNERTGEALLFGRVEAALLPDPLPGLRLPLLGRPRLQPGGFLEWGALRRDGWPEPGYADAGVSVERYIGFFALDAIRMNVAWRLPEGAPRVTVEFRRARA
jgi:hypothetical protein